MQLDVGGVPGALVGKTGCLRVTYASRPVAVVVAAALVVAFLVQAIALVARSVIRDGAQIQALDSVLAGASVLLVLAALLTLTATPALLRLSPSDCAPLSVSQARLLGGVAVLAFVLLPAFGLLAAWRALRHVASAWPVFGEGSALGVASAAVSVLAGGTSC